MKFSTYDGLIKEVKNWSNRSDLSDDQLGSFAYLAGGLASQTLRVPAQEWTQILTVEEDGHVVIPDDFVALRSLTFEYNSNSSVPLSRVAWDQLVNYRNAEIQDFSTHFFARQGPYWFLCPEPAAGTKITCHYYRTLPDIDPTEQTNWLIQMSPFTYLAGSLHFLYLYIQDEERSEYWLKKFQGEIIRVQQMADGDEYSGGSLAVRAKTYDGTL